MLYKKILSAALALTIVVSAAACSSQSGDSSSTTAPPAATTAAPAADSGSDSSSDSSSDSGTEEEADAEPEQQYDEAGFPIDEEGNRIYVQPFELRPARDMGGQPLIVDAWWLDFDWNREWPDDDPGTKTYKTLLEEAQVRYNTTIEFTVSGWGENLEKLAASVLANDPYCDLIRLENYQGMPNAVSKGLLVALDDLPDYIDVETEVSDYVKTVGSFAGKTYGYLNQEEGLGEGMFFNMDIIEREGLENPYVLMKNDQWTWEKFFELCKAATKVAADGTTEQYGIGASDWQLGLFLMLSNDGQMVDEMTQTFVGDDPKTIEALEFLQRLGTEGVLKAGEERETFLAGQSLFIPIGAWFQGTIQEQGIKHGFIPMPKGPSGSGYASVSFGPNMYFVPKGANYEMLTIYQESGREAAHFSNPDPDRWAEPFSYDEEAFFMLIDMRDNYFRNKMERSSGFGIRQIIPWIQFLTGEAQPVSAIEGLKAQAQALIDEAFAGN